MPRKVQKEVTTGRGTCVPGLVVGSLLYRLWTMPNSISNSRQRTAVLASVVQSSFFLLLILLDAERREYRRTWTMCAVVTQSWRWCLQDVAMQTSSHAPDNCRGPRKVHFTIPSSISAVMSALLPAPAAQPGPKWLKMKLIAERVIV